MQHPNTGPLAQPRLRPHRAPSNPASGGAGDETPPYSILALGRRLGALRIETDKLEELSIELGEEGAHDPFDASRLARRHAKAAHDATEQHCGALEDLILSSRAEDAQGALVQVLIATCRLHIIAREGEPHTERDRVGGALQSAVRALAAALGIKLIEVGGPFYASTWCDRWPAVDAAGIEEDEPGLSLGSIDGSMAA